MMGTGAVRCLITGCEGFLGSHLADMLVSRHLDVVGTLFEADENVKHLRPRMEFVNCDLTSKDQVFAAVESAKPDVVFHLGAQSFVMVSWDLPELTLQTNILGTTYLLEAVRRVNREATVVVASSSAVLGPRDTEDLPLDEDKPFRPSSIYAVSKVGEEMLAIMYWKVHGMRVLRVRPFNITGPRKTSDACSDFAKGIVQIERGMRDSLEVGNLDSIRDFTDGRDAANALWKVATNGSAGEVYNICSGKGHVIRTILEVLISLSSCEVSYHVGSKKLRPFDDPAYIGDGTKIRCLGWAPKIPLERTLEDTLDYWRTLTKGHLRAAGETVLE